MYQADVTIVGAGVVGLAVAAQVAGEGRRVFGLEKRESFGLETSSRNSQVIHSGIYYPDGSLKARFCVEGKATLYHLARSYGIAHRPLGKLIVATTDTEVAVLDELLSQGSRNGVMDLRPLSRSDIKRLEPNVEGVAGLLSPSSGIIDSHALMRFLASKARDSGAQIVYRSEVVGIDRTQGGYRVTVRDPQESFQFQTRALVNCAGLDADRIASLAGIDIAEAGYRLHYCKGEYFILRPRQETRVGRLVYPAPDPEGAGLGIHLTLDVEGQLRLGPNAWYVDSRDYQVDASQQAAFWESARRYLPALECADLEPDFAGIRPKLSGPGQGFRDFVIRHEHDRGLPGLINLVGIESPGLTSAPSIARYVADELLPEIL